MKLNLAVIFGGKTCEHDVSIISGLQAAHAADRSKYDVTIIYLSRDGQWYIGDALKDANFFTAFDAEKATRVLPMAEDGKLLLLEYPTEKRRLFGGGRNVLASIDVVMPVMHGMNGEDGTLQGLLELWNVPYTSAGVLGSAVGMDKIAMKRMFRGCGFPVLDDIWADRSEWERGREKVLDRAEAALTYPMFVKPANLGSSIGISKAVDRVALARAVDVAAAYDRRILIEQGISSLDEINCSAMGYAGEVRVSETEMPVRWDDEDLLDFDGKYTRNAGKGAGKGMSSLSRKIPAPVSEERNNEVKVLTEAVFRALDCKGVVRIDYLLDKEKDRLYVGEINIIPGSLAFYLWEPLGVSFADLIDAMVEYALAAWSERNKSVFSYDSAILKTVISGSKGAKR